MTSRERVLAALDHREPARVPVDFGAERSSGIAAIAYAKLQTLLGLKEQPVRIWDVIQQLALIDEDVLDRYGIDAVEIGRAFLQNETSWVDWTLPDGTPAQMPVWALPERDGNNWVYRSKNGRIIAHMSQGVCVFERTYYPFAEGADLDTFEVGLQNRCGLQFPALHSP